MYTGLSRTGQSVRFASLIASGERGMGNRIKVYESIVGIASNLIDHGQWRPEAVDLLRGSKSHFFHPSAVLTRLGGVEMYYFSEKNNDDDRKWMCKTTFYALSF